jgi:hypothetical protein
MAMTATDYLDRLRAETQAREELEFELRPPRSPFYYASEAEHRRYDRYLDWKERRKWAPGLCGYCGNRSEGDRCRSCGERERERGLDDTQRRTGVYPIGPLGLSASNDFDDPQRTRTEQAEPERYNADGNQ